jgi:FAD:protein FMN transferase
MDLTMPSKKLKTKLEHSWEFEAIGTWWSIETSLSLRPEIKQSISEHIDQFDRTYSRFRDDSVVAAMAERAGSYILSDEAPMLERLYHELYVATQGAVTPLIGRSLNALGYDKHYSFDVHSAVPAQEWRDVLEWKGRMITAKQPLVLDVGAAGKGLLVDIVAGILERFAVTEYIVDASGDIRTAGVAQRIGLENPLDTTRVIGVAHIENESLCASAVNRRRWGEGLHHIVDGRSGKSVDGVTATWVVAESAMIADGIATGLFFVPAQQLRHIAPFQFVKLFSNGNIEHSDHFVGELFI